MYPWHVLWARLGVPQEMGLPVPLAHPAPSPLWLSQGLLPGTNIGVLATKLGFCVLMVFTAPFGVVTARETLVADVDAARTRKRQRVLNIGAVLCIMAIAVIGAVGISALPKIFAYVLVSPSFSFAYARV